MAVSKFSCAVKDLTGLPGLSVSHLAPENALKGSWVKVLSAPIQTASQKDLLIDVSLVTSLFTDTSVSSQLLQKVSAQAEACIDVQVLVDGKTLDKWPLSGPNTPVTFDRRAQTLIAQFAGLAVTDPVTGIVTVTSEFLEFILDTTAAHSFKWVVADLQQGNHTVEVQARLTIDSNVSSGGSAAAAGCVGWGSCVVEEIRLIRGATPLTP